MRYFPVIIALFISLLSSFAVPTIPVFAEQEERILRFNDPGSLSGLYRAVLNHETPAIISLQKSTCARSAPAMVA
jgi:hypothetical protein